MNGKLNDREPIFEQIKRWISDQIIDGTLETDDKIPSTNEIVQFYKVNHLTVSKGVNQLAEDDIIYKKRGVGMFVAEGAKEKLIEARQDSFLKEYLKPMMEEAEKLKIDKETINQMMEEERK